MSSSAPHGGRQGLVIVAATATACGRGHRGDFVQSEIEGRLGPPRTAEHGVGSVGHGVGNVGHGALVLRW